MGPFVYDESALSKPAAIFILAIATELLGHSHDENTVAMLF